ncbi:MAG: hypothetical protein IJ486_10535 [Firmicutes bacterium]|nr:hypothetical protein [Bacillota bacterium]
MSNVLKSMTLLKEQFERTLQHNQRQLKFLPKGTLTIKRVKNLSYLCWLKPSAAKHDGRRCIILKENNRKIAEQLRRRRIIQKQNPLLSHNIQVIDRFLNSYIPCDDSTCLRSLSPAYSESLNFQCFDKAITNPSFPEDLSHSNSVGEVFRSRIEAQISEILLSRGVKYDYDVALQLGTKTRYPDFRITHPKTGEFIYLEYFGKMYEEDYAQKNLIKIQEYLQHNYVYGKNLMFFFENSKGIDLAAISRVIDMLIQ